MTDAEIERALAAFGGDHLPVKAAGERWIRTRAFPLARLALDRGKEIERLRAALNSIDALDPEWQGIENLSRDAAAGLVMRMGDIARAALNGGNDAE